MDEERYESFLHAMNAMISLEAWPCDYERDIRETAWFGMGYDPNVNEYKMRWEKERPDQVKLVKGNILGNGSVKLASPRQGFV